MADTIDTLSFVRLDQPGHLESQQFRLVSHGGADGLTIWDVGLRGEPFTIRALALTADFAAAWALYESAKSLEQSGLVNVAFGGTTIASHKYKVLKVNPVPNGIRALVYGRGPGGAYYGRCELEITLLPVATP